MALVRQHLIDPEICIRCNTCEETCPVDAVTHDDVNYVVDPDICQPNLCMECLGPCPTGAIDSWRLTSRPWALEEQFGWDELPPDEEADEDEELPPEPAEVAEIRREAGSEGGRVVPPFSAAHPYLNVYSRERPAVATVVGNYRLTDDDAGSDVRHIILDMGTQFFPVLEGQSIGVMPPGTDAKGREHHVRLYSVASPRDGERPNHNNLALTVKRVVVQENGTETRGVASNYLCDLGKGDEVRVTGPFGTTFLMPNHPGANIVMVCTGTGSAPMRAMTERRRRLMPEGPGKLLLFFGARTPGELPYFGPLMRLPKQFIDVELAFSRLADKPKEYVQDRLRGRAGEVAELLKSDDTYVYVCGVKGMEDGCDEVLEEICKDCGLEWRELRPRMRESGRFHVETY